VSGRRTRQGRDGAVAPAAVSASTGRRGGGGARGAGGEIEKGNRASGWLAGEGNKWPAESREWGTSVVGGL